LYLLPLPQETRHAFEESRQAKGCVGRRLDHEAADVYSRYATQAACIRSVCPSVNMNMQESCV
jgi:hypothetical protein